MRKTSKTVPLSPEAIIGIGPPFGEEALANRQQANQALVDKCQELQASKIIRIWMDTSTPTTTGVDLALDLAEQSLELFSTSVLEDPKDSLKDRASLLGRATIASVEMEGDNLKTILRVDNEPDIVFLSSFGFLTKNEHRLKAKGD